MSLLRNILPGILLTIAFESYAQHSINKPTLDSSVFGKWPYNANVSINADGRYCQYWVIDPLAGTKRLMIQCNENAWKYSLDAPIGSMNFSTDGLYSIFLLQGDSLGVLKLGHNAVRFLTHVSSYRVLLGAWIAYVQTGKDSGLKMLNLRTGQARSYPVPYLYFPNPTGSAVLLLQRARQDIMNIGLLTNLIWVQVGTGQQQHLWEGNEIKDINFDKTGTRVAFMGKKHKDTGNYWTLFAYHRGQDSAERVASNTSVGLNGQFQLVSSKISFNVEGTMLLFRVQVPEIRPISVYSEYAEPIIWNYLDSHRVAHASDDQIIAAKETPQYWAVAQLSNGNVRVLNQKEEVVEIPENWGKYLLITSNGSFLPDDYYYNRRDAGGLWIINLQNGQRTLLDSGINILTNYCVSPNDSFAVWFNRDSLTWYSYELAIGKKHNLSRQAPVALYDTMAARIGIHASQGLAGWGSGGALYIYDSYDIWSLDLSSRRNGFSLTNGYGRRNGITFSMPDIAIYAFLGGNIVNGSLLAAYNRKTKQNGFWSLHWGHDPICYCMNDYCYDIARIGTTAFIEGASGAPPIQAGRLKKYLVLRQRAEEFPNYYWTQNFKKFVAVTDLHPERRYNWLQTELVNWQLPDGKLCQGILYKPENLDKGRRYPLIFDYYAKRSDELHRYIEPAYSDARINIPYYVSNGYVIFVPDIWQQPGHNGKGALDAIVSAVTQLSKYPWIDTAHMGLQGHSFGGQETNYLVTHTTQFAAACAASGISDDISFYGEVGLNVNSRFFETILQGSPYGLGITPWTRSDLYIENNSILSIGQARTPLLIMHGDQDPAVPFAQALEMFLDMRRAGKKVWMLEYPHGSHILQDDNAKDFTIRMKQFFDHYLQGKPAPIWMLDPMDRYGGKKDSGGYELDKTGRVP